ILNQAWHTSDLVLTTGGLGPTEDDITKSTLGRFFGGELRENEKAKKLALEHYARIEKVWSPETNSYHLIPDGMEPIPNPKGLAPGLSYSKEGKLFMAAPGVPRELKGMIETEFPLLLDKVFPSRKQKTQVLTIRTIGVPEEKIFFQLMPNLWKDLSQWGKVSSLPQVLGVDINLTIDGGEAELLKARNHWQTELKKSPLAQTIWSWDHLTLEELVVFEANQKGLTISIAESCTGGLVANRITNVPGSSSVFLSSVVAYANEVKVNILGVKSETLKSYGAVSEQTAGEMAMGVRKVIGSDISISLTGIAGPGGGSEEKPVGTVCMGIDSSLETLTKTYNFRGDRDHLKNRFSEMALYKLLQVIRAL
ncbi:MAG: nicotinamide-nucleotide amidohydrolase family protein, partial [Halobacteriovoraceae bacterium]|nr:nicotinamide-nucleotide amidohydrolase family protein [Halobacteriovoraceae bacterium]